MCTSAYPVTNTHTHVLIYMQSCAHTCKATTHSYAARPACVCTHKHTCTTSIYTYICNTHTHIAYLPAHIHLPASTHMHTPTTHIHVYTCTTILKYMYILFHTRVTHMYTRIHKHACITTLRCTYVSLHARTLITYILIHTHTKPCLVKPSYP